MVTGSYNSLQPLESKYDKFLNSDVFYRFKVVYFNVNIFITNISIGQNLYTRTLVESLFKILPIYLYLRRKNGYKKTL